MPPTVPAAVESSAIMRVFARIRRVELRKHLECEGEQRIARENRHGVAEDLVVGELAAAVVVVIERRQIVVNQRVGVDELERAGRRDGAVSRPNRKPRAPASMHRMGRMRLPPANRL
jgi:hypothetical protein